MDCLILLFSHNPIKSTSLLFTIYHKTQLPFLLIQMIKL